MAAASGSNPDIPGPSQLPSPSLESTVSSRVLKAEVYKEDGNKRYKEKDLKGAIGKYHRALLCVKDINKVGQPSSAMLQDIFQMNTNKPRDEGPRNGNLPEEIANRVINIETSCYNNLSACLLLEENPNYEKIVSYCQNVLDHDEANTKALYRQGVALFHLKNYEKAHSCLRAASENSPSDSNIRQQLKLCEDMLAKNRKAEKKMYQQIFQKMNSE